MEAATTTAVAGRCTGTFARGEVDYLLQTHDQSQSRRALRQACRQTQWLGLSILAVDGGGVDDREGTVRFEARHRRGVALRSGDRN